jgi:hypothetical protein
MAYTHPKIQFQRQLPGFKLRDIKLTYYGLVKPEAVLAMLVFQENVQGRIWRI